MIRVAALTSGADVPSARFRVRQHIVPLRSLDIEVVDYCPAISQLARLPGKLGSIRQRYMPPVAAGQVLLNAALRLPGVFGTYRADVTWIERNFVPGLDGAVVWTKAPRILDVDDAIWLSTLLGKSAAQRLARRVDAVIAGNSYLADWYGNYCRKVYVIPTAIDCDRFAPIPEIASSENRFVVGWTGTAGNLRFLQDIELPLSRFLHAHPAARLTVVSDKRPTFALIPAAQFEFVRWTPANEALSLQQMDVGLMPLPDTEWARGKCSYKMLQYMATALPVIVSPVGMNAEVLKMGRCGLAASTLDDWFGALETLHDRREIRAAMGQSGRAIALATFSIPVVAHQLADAFPQTLK